jgi:hypothetical protein
MSPGHHLSAGRPVNLFPSFLIESNNPVLNIVCFLLSKVLLKEYPTDQKSERVLTAILSIKRLSK